MPKGGCSRTPQQEERSLSSDMVEKQPGKKVSSRICTGSDPGVAHLPARAALLVSFLSFLHIFEETTREGRVQKSSSRNEDATGTSVVTGL